MGVWSVIRRTWIIQRAAQPKLPPVFHRFQSRIPHNTRYYGFLFVSWELWLPLFATVYCSSTQRPVVGNCTNYPFSLSLRDCTRSPPLRAGMCETKHPVPFHPRALPCSVLPVWVAHSAPFDRSGALIATSHNGDKSVLLTSEFFLLIQCFVTITDTSSSRFRCWQRVVNLSP